MPVEKKAKTGVDEKSGEEKGVAGARKPLKPVITLRAVDVHVGKGHVGGQNKPKNVEEWNALPHNLYCGRWMFCARIKSPYFNPVRMLKDLAAKDPEAERKRAIAAFEAHMDKKQLHVQLQAELVRRVQQHPEISAFSLGCWCKPLPCHVDQLIARVCALPCKNFEFRA